MEYYAIYFLENLTLLKIISLFFPISKEFFIYLAKNDKNFEELNKNVKISFQTKKRFHIYEVLKKYVYSRLEKDQINNIEKDLFYILKGYDAKHHFDIINSLTIFEKFDYLDSKASDYYNELGIYYMNLSDLVKSEEFFFMSLNIPNIDKKDICTTYINLAELYRNNEKFNSAKENAFKALEIAETINDDSRSWKELMSMLFNGIALLYLQKYHFKKAQEYFIKSLKISKKGLYTQLSTTYSNIALCYYESGNLSKAEHYYHKALELDEKYNDMTYHLAVTCNNMAIFYQDLNKFETAEKFYLKLLEIENNINSTEESKVTSYLNIGSFYKDIGKYENSLYYLKIAREKLRYIRNHYLGSQLNNSFGMLLIEMRRYNESRSYFEVALKYIKKMEVIDYPQLSTIYENIASSYLYEKNYNKVEEKLFKALKIREEKLGTYHLDTAQIYNNIGVYYLETDKLEYADEYLQKSLKIRKKLLGDNTIDISSSYNNLAIIYNSLGYNDKAKEYYLKTIEILENLLGKKHNKTSFCYKNYAHFLYEMAVNTKEKKFLEEAKIYYKKAYTSIEQMSEFMSEYTICNIFYIMTKYDLKEEITQDVCNILKNIEYANLSNMLENNDQFEESLVLLYGLLDKVFPGTKECKERFEMIIELMKEESI